MSDAHIGRKGAFDQFFTSSKGDRGPLHCGKSGPAALLSIAPEKHRKEAKFMFYRDHSVTSEK